MSYRTNNVLNVDIPYYKLKENLSITYRERCRRTNNLCLALTRSLLEPIRQHMKKKNAVTLDVIGQRMPVDQRDRRKCSATLSTDPSLKFVSPTKFNDDRVDDETRP